MQDQPIIEWTRYLAGLKWQILPDGDSACCIKRKKELGEGMKRRQKTTLSSPISFFDLCPFFRCCLSIFFEHDKCFIVRQAKRATKCYLVQSEPKQPPPQIALAKPILLDMVSSISSLACEPPLLVTSTLKTNEVDCNVASCDSLYTTVTITKSLGDCL